MSLTQKQIETKTKIDFYSRLFGVDPLWAAAVAMVESALGEHQKSPTGARGVFQMTSIAMKDLLQSMEVIDDDTLDIVCGIAFLKLLLKRWKTIEVATNHYCDPGDISFYLARVEKFMGEFANA
ncbi:MAG: transglycosylase SLT domain-containing protein [Gammaproteobacteria bacterium]|uniref:Putative transglycosylase n=1 Tax=viral metagenome TaxID=1070528 RepID=A0A6M3IFW0_9ZZZZ|nr:transglycosylase SLT domain-containing protein [Gammaproteobacteria bacterium]